MLRFRISNMGCDGCAKGVTAVLREIDPAAQTTFDLDACGVTVATALNDADRFDAVLRDGSPNARPADDSPDMLRHG